MKWFLNRLWISQHLSNKSTRSCQEKEKSCSISRADFDWLVDRCVAAKTSCDASPCQDHLIHMFLLQSASAGVMFKVNPPQFHPEPFNTSARTWRWRIISLNAQSKCFLQLSKRIRFNFIFNTKARLKKSASQGPDGSYSFHLMNLKLSISWTHMWHRNRCETENDNSFISLLITAAHSKQTEPSSWLDVTSQSDSELLTNRFSHLTEPSSQSDIF